VKPVSGLRRTAVLFYDAPLPSREIRRIHPLHSIDISRRHRYFSRRRLEILAKSIVTIFVGA